MVTHVEFVQQKLLGPSQNLFGLVVHPLHWPMGSRGAQKVAWWGSGASAMHFGEHFITQKLLGAPNLVGIGNLMGPQIQVWKDLGPVCFWSCWASLSMGIFKMKVVVFVLNRYLDSFLPIVYDHRDRALAWRGPAGTYVWLCQHNLVIKSKHTLFKTSFEKSQAMTGHPG